MKLKIISDGTAIGTKVVTDPGGVMIEGVISVKWEVGLKDEEAKVQLTILGMDAEAVRGEVIKGEVEETREISIEELMRIELEFCKRRVREGSESSTRDFSRGYWTGRVDVINMVLKCMKGIGKEGRRMSQVEERVRR